MTACNRCGGIETFYGHTSNALDPRDFTPDRSTNTPDEIAAWEQARGAAERGSSWEPPCREVVVGGQVVSWGSPGAWGWGEITVRCPCRDRDP